MRDNSFLVIVLILALLYIVNPIDLMPDVIPVVGWVDDLAVGVGAGVAALAAGQRWEESMKPSEIAIIVLIVAKAVVQAPKLTEKWKYTT